MNVRIARARVVERLAQRSVEQTERERTKYMYTIYSTESCSYCKAAKQLLDARSLEYNELILGRDWTVEDLHKILPDAKTVPQVFDGQNYIGGFVDLAEHLEHVAGLEDNPS